MKGGRTERGDDQADESASSRHIDRSSKKYRHPQHAASRQPARTDAVGHPAEEWLGDGSRPDVDRGDERDLRFVQAEIREQDGARAVEHVYDEVAERDGREEGVEEEGHSIYDFGFTIDDLRFLIGD